MFSRDYDPNEDQAEWVEEKYAEIDEHYVHTIPDDNLRKLFLRGLAYAFAEDDKEFSEELKKTEFTVEHKACIFELYDEIREYFYDYVMDLADSYRSYY